MCFSVAGPQNLPPRADPARLFARFPCTGSRSPPLVSFFYYSIRLPIFASYSLPPCRFCCETLCRLPRETRWTLHRTRFARLKRPVSCYDPSTAAPPNQPPQANQFLPLSAVARIAYLASDVVISVQPSLATDSEFSAQLKKHVERKDQSLVASGPDAIPAVSRPFCPPLAQPFLRPTQRQWPSSRGLGVIIR